MSEILGINIEEVWCHRLSSATVALHRNKLKFWRIDINPKANGTGTPIESIETKIPVEKGYAGLIKGQAACFAILRDIRDKYALPSIEELKPRVALINAKGQALAKALEGKSVEEGNAIFNSVLAQLKTELGE